MSQYNGHMRTDVVSWMIDRAQGEGSKSDTINAFGLLVVHKFVVNNLINNFIPKKYSCFEGIVSHHGKSLHCQVCFVALVEKHVMENNGE